MLIDFRVENHRSIGPDQVLGLQAVLRGASDDIARTVDGSPDDLLPAVALYGANASGKTNVLRALAFMRLAVLQSQRLWAPDEGVRREPFAWGKLRGKPSSFEVDFVQLGVRYQYGYVADDKRFLEEWLFAWPNGRKQTWFERDAQTFKFSEHLRGENKTIQAVTRPNALFLSAAAQLNHAQLMPVLQWFGGVQAFNVSQTVPRGREMMSFDDLSVETWLYAARKGVTDPFSGTPDLSAPAKVKSFTQLIKEADVGIVGFEVVNDISPANDVIAPRVQFQHESSARKALLPMEQESDGTRTLARMAPYLIDTLEGGGVLLVDELEAGFHPLLAAKVVSLFNSPSSNPKNAQLIFTTHDTTFLGTAAAEPILRRDQVWLTEKDKEGATALYPLTDYKPRKEENLERGYLQGRYGAIPFLGALLPDEG